MPYTGLLISFLFGTSIVASGVPIDVPTDAPIAHVAAATSSAAARNASLPDGVPSVPFYSQLRDIQAVEWRKLGCGVASLTMIIDFYRPEVVSVNTLLKEGIAAGAYLKNAGWKHAGLALLADKYGLEGESYDLSNLKMADAFARFEKFLKEGPIIASVYYKFDPESPIPHMVVITGIAGDRIYYNDPAGLAGGKEISLADFMRGWKKRFIVVRPQSP